MKKTVLQSTVILVIVSVIAKALSFIVRIMLARTLSPSAMNYYTLAAPTMVFFITLAQMGIPGALSKVIAQSDHPHQPLKVSVILSLLNNAVIILTFLLVLPFLATRILKQKEILPVLYAIIPLIPLVSLSGILKGYLFGLQHHVQATSSQLFEEGSRILFLFVVFYLHPFTDAITMARIAMLSVSVGEACSALFMLISLRRQKRTLSRIPRLFSDLNRRQFDEVLTVSIPMTGSRLIGSLTYFMEPIVMVLGLGTAASAAMVGAYGQLNGYVLPIITMPSFITVTLSNFLLPSFTYSYSRGYYDHARRLFSMIIGYCFLVGLGCSVICYLFPEQLLYLFYHNTHGALLLKQLAIPFALYSLQPPLSSMLHALSLSKQTVADTLSGSLVRILCVLFLTRTCMEASLPIALTAGMLITTTMHAVRLFIAFKNN